MLNKLWHYGFWGSALDWIKSYLSNRAQYVTYNGVNSNSVKITYGGPPGSILGPLLFLLYVNDIANVSKIVNPILYADDTNIFLDGDDVNSIVECMNVELAKFMNWMNVSKLSVNVQKTH